MRTETPTNDPLQRTTGQGLHHYSNTLHTFHTCQFSFQSDNIITQLNTIGIGKQIMAQLYEL